MANIELMRRVLDHIDRYPEQHEQDTWIVGQIGAVAADNGDHPPCGTAMCFAGWAAFLGAPAGTEITGAFVTPPNGVRQHVSDYATNLLGLDIFKADEFFAASNTRESLGAMVDAMAADPETDWRALYQVRGSILDR